jgi:F-type H+-transporting ATPase subunit a
MSAFLAGGVLAAGSPLDHILPHALPDGLGLGQHVTNHVLMLAAAALLMLIVFPWIARAKGPVPTGLRNALEALLQFIRETVARPALREATDRFVPFLWTSFFLVLFANLIGMLPIDALITAVTGHESHFHFGGTATGNLSITAGLALSSFLLIHLGGMKEQGVVHYWKSFVPHVPGALYPLMFVLELIGSLVKPFALAIRLFANMIAGHIVLAVLIGFMGVLASGVSGLGIGVAIASVIGAVFISLLELLVAFLQAYIFTYLTALFIGMAVHPEH